MEEYQRFADHYLVCIHLKCHQHVYLVQSLSPVRDDSVKTSAADDVAPSSRPARAATEKSWQQVLEWMTDNGDL